MTTPDSDSGQQKIRGNELRYTESIVRQVKANRKAMKIRGVEIGEMQHAELAAHALLTKSDAHRMAAIAELLARLVGGDNVRIWLRQLPTVKHREQRQ